MEFEGSDLLKLVELLQLNTADGSDTDEIINKDVEIQSRTKTVHNDFVPKSLEEFEIQQEKELDEYLSNNKKQPNYDLKYRQAVATEDIFLQIGAKTPSSASCEDMIVTIELPDEMYSAMELDVTKTDVKLEGFHYKLHLPLPHPVNPDVSNAKWDQGTQTLILTLRLCREFDYVNF